MNDLDLRIVNKKTVIQYPMVIYGL